jgi:hypothetical protein
MKLKILFLMLFLLPLPWLKEMKAQHISILLYDGTVNTEMLSAVQKLSFQDGNLLLTHKSGSADSYALSTVRKLDFDMQTSISELNSDGDCKMTLFPDPADNVITLQYIPDGSAQVYIYGVDGKLLLQTVTSPENRTIDVSNLLHGLYLLKTNGRAIKFIKL